MKAKADQFSDDEVDVSMTPLIDCVFLLLTFFLVAATLKKPHKELKLELPHSAAAATVASKYDTLIVEVSKDGEVFIESQPMTTKLLNETLHRIAAETPDRRVRVDADRQTPAQYLVRLFDHLQFVGLTSVGLRTRD